jgi:hypothetical protein
LFLGNYELGEAQEDASTEYGENILLSGQNIEIIEAPHINFDSPDYLYQYDPIFNGVLKGGETYRLGIFF